ncbi:hypothetical protein THRCLA_11205 [Thraustotheca clavata]|uniref:Uncharacterized protein n=1 Tax=Thraustotheca clavata TaxID=74557 RepID=A0A1V9Y8G2_9STRA|nr:hypothetical protein THRCLA_11205 [Thraustotheca clavata]
MKRLSDRTRSTEATTPLRSSLVLPTIPESPLVDSRDSWSEDDSSLLQEHRVHRRHSSRVTPPPILPPEVDSHVEMAEQVVHAIEQEDMSGHDKVMAFIRELGEKKRKSVVRRKAEIAQEHEARKARIQAQQEEINKEIEHQKFQSVNELTQAYENLVDKYKELVHDIKAKDSLITTLQAKTNDELNDAQSDIQCDDDTIPIKTTQTIFHVLYTDILKQYPWLDDALDKASWLALGVLTIFALYAFWTYMRMSVELADEKAIRDLMVHFRRRMTT